MQKNEIIKVKEIIEDYGKPRKFHLPIGEVSISAEQSAWVRIRQKYYLIIQKIKEIFIIKCKTEPESRDDLEDVQGVYYACMSVLYKEIQADIFSMGRYDIDSDMLDKMAEDENVCWHFKAVMAALYDLYGEQTMTSSYREIYGRQVKTFKQRMGISIEDYIRQTGTLGALHKVFDTLDFDIARLIVDIIESGTDCELDFSDVRGSVQENQKCLRLLSNLESGVIPEDKVADILLDILEIDPLISKTYTTMIKYFGDEKKEIFTVAKYLAIDDIILAYKQIFAEEYVEKLSMDTEEAALEAKENFIKYCDYLGIEKEDREDIGEEIDSALEDFDRAYRTVDGITLETREEADLARGELLAIKAFMEKIAPPNKDSLLDYEQELQEKKTEFENTFSSGLKGKYLRQIEKYLSDFDDLFCTVGLFKKLDRKEAGKERLFKIIKERPVSSPEDIEKAYAYMGELLPKVGLESTETEKTKLYLEGCKDEAALKFVKQNCGITEDDAIAAKEKLIEFCESMQLTVTDELKCMKYINKLLTDFDLQYRTVDGVECTTREGADKAREELEAITEFMSTVEQPTSESLLDYEHDLIKKRDEFKECFQSELKDKYLRQFEKYLDEFDRKFCSVGIFKKVDRKQAGKERALKFVKKQDYSSPEKVEQIYMQLEELLPNFGITKEEAQEAFQYLERKREKKSLFGGVFRKK